MTNRSTGLASLEQALARDMAKLNLPPASWVPEKCGPESQPMVDVVVVGAGMCGLAAAFALRCTGISRLRHLDRGDKGYEGPWLTYARMNTLRSPKHLTGPVLGLPNLTFRAWFEAMQGTDAWETLDRIDRTLWMEYLQWYRRVTGASIENNVAVTSITPLPDFVLINCLHPDGRVEAVHARQVILATGREGQSRARIPPPFIPLLGKQVQHASAAIDFSALKGKHVAVVGIAASAFDNAATARESGAAKVTLIGRANTLPRYNRMKPTFYPGFTQGYPALPDKMKLQIMRYIAESRIAPPRASVLRVSGDPCMKLLLGSGVVEARKIEDKIQLLTQSSTLEVDHVILGTGFAIDLDSTPEIADFSSQVLRWKDQLPNEPDDEWMNAPYLGKGFEFQEKAPGALPGLSRIRCFTHTAQLSLGNLANDIPAVSDGAQRLVNAVACTLFTEDSEHHWDKLVAYDEPELLGNEWPGASS